MNKHLQCLVCAAEKLRPLANYYEKHGLVKCQNCGLVFMEQIPTVEELNKHYEKYSYTSEGYLSPLTIKSYQALLDEFEAYRKNNKILDVGCGRGWFLEEAKKRGWDVYGTEYSQTAVAVCQKKAIKMKEGQLNPDDFTEGEFDVITSFEVLEHINNPNEDVENIYKLLRKGGLFYCTTPNFNSLNRYYLKEDYNVIVYPEHLTYYTRNTLNRLAKQNQFQPIKFLSTGISITRIKTSKKVSDEKYISKESSDEKLRQNIDKKWYLQIGKRLVNHLLTLFSLGMTLKGYYIKR